MKPTLHAQMQPLLRQTAQECERKIAYRRRPLQGRRRDDDRGPGSWQALSRSVAGCTASCPSVAAEASRARAARSAGWWPRCCATHGCRIDECAPSHRLHGHAATSRCGGRRMPPRPCPGRRRNPARDQPGADPQDRDDQASPPARRGPVVTHSRGKHTAKTLRAPGYGSCD